MIVLVGASASGKTELAKLLYNSYGYKKCITTTTRLKRNNEIQDIDYHFISHRHFLDMQSSNLFVEVTKYQDNLYGIQKNDVLLNGVVIVDIAGANALIDKIDKDVFVVFVESSENLRKQRMIIRGDELVKVEQRINSDRLLFNPQLIKRINLYVKNETHILNDLANLIHQNYQSYLNK